MTPSEKQLGLLEAIVSSVPDDPYQRIKVHYPRLKDRSTGLPIESGLIPVLSPYGASESVRPKKDDQVIIAFVNGDPLTPIVLGKIYSEKKPPGG